jgi:ferredoxin
MSPVTGQQATRLRFAVDADVCAGHGRCYSLDPEHFEADDLGYARVLDGVEPSSKREQMEEIVQTCPEAAISIEVVSD